MDKLIKLYHNIIHKYINCRYYILNINRIIISYIGRSFDNFAYTNEYNTLPITKVSIKKTHNDATQNK